MTTTRPDRAPQRPGLIIAGLTILTAVVLGTLFAWLAWHLVELRPI